MNKKTILTTGTLSVIGKAAALYFQKKGRNVAAKMRSPEQGTTPSDNVLNENIR